MNYTMSLFDFGMENSFIHQQSFDRQFLKSKVMTEVNNAENESVGESSVSSQKAEIKDSNERKIKDLQFQNRELKN